MHLIGGPIPGPTSLLSQQSTPFSCLGTSELGTSTVSLWQILLQKN
jgi:hypothetical protein